ncbi:hypothetical protein Dda_7182 [Drechslerella dactyloides]|uniref:Uncharacterized protein n=1 Tax=Drechslerella dactyloides TaxID=74499 RepID=A0AAD6NIT4_DREDA|nr:hypothetical protein Dda_7182 [Drechslerella dactyloides]
MEALPPPYPSSKEVEQSPYDPHDSALHYNYPTALPAFDAPRRYNSRLRRLLQQRSSSRGVYLTLHIPHALNNCKLISIESASTCSSSMSSASSTSSSAASSSSSTADDNASISTNDMDAEGLSENLIHYISTNEKTPLLYDPTVTPFIDDLEAGVGIPRQKPYHSSLKSSNKSARGKKTPKRVKFKRDPKHRSRDKHAYGYLGFDEEKETSWLTFFLLLLLAFTMVCAAGVFIAWALGFTMSKAATASSGVVSASVTEVTSVVKGGVVSGPQSPVVAVKSGEGVTSEGEKRIEPRGEERLVRREDTLSRVWRHVKKDLIAQENMGRPREIRSREIRTREIRARDAAENHYLGDSPE